VFFSLVGIVESIIYGAEGLKPLDRWFSLLDGLMSEFGISVRGGRRAVTCSMVRALALRRPLYSAMERWATAPWSCPGQARTSPPGSRPSFTSLPTATAGGNCGKLEILLDSLGR